MTIYPPVRNSPVKPDACPACGSSSIATTAKTPDATSYWRCTVCGEIWNDVRRKELRKGVSTWR